MSGRREKAGHGYLGKNTYYEEGTNKPQYYGKLTVEDLEFELAGWDREKDGRAYVSLQVNKVVIEEGVLPPGTDSDLAKDSSSTPPVPGMPDDDVPF